MIPPENVSFSSPKSGEICINSNIKELDPFETKKTITIQAVINAPCEKVWELYTSPEYIVQLNHVSADWRSPKAENDLQPRGKFLYRMEVINGSTGFDFWSIYHAISTNRLIAYTMGDKRKVKIKFTKNKNRIKKLLSSKLRIRLKYS